MDTKERTIMNQECSSIVRMNKGIKFVCVTDRKVKLLVGKSRDILSSTITGDDANTDIIRSSNYIISSRVDNSFGVKFQNTNLRHFYLDYLLWTIRKCGIHSDCGGNNNDLYIFKRVGEKKEGDLIYFQVSGLIRDSVKLAITPLDLSMHKFLCIYFEPAYKILRNSDNGIDEKFECFLSKIKTKINRALLRIDHPCI